MKTIFAIFRNEALYIGDWCSFHLEKGWDKICLLDDHSTDDPYPSLAAFGNKVQCSRPAERIGQCQAYEGYRKSTEAEWTAYIDIDEYLVLNPAMLDSVESKYNAVVVHGFNFGYADYDDRQVTQRCVRHFHCSSIEKSIVRNERAAWTKYTHIPNIPRNEIYLLKCQDGRINHYVVKSEAELKVKCSRGWPLDYAWCNDTQYIRHILSQPFSRWNEHQSPIYRLYIGDWCSFHLEKGWDKICLLDDHSTDDPYPSLAAFGNKVQCECCE
ncbi:hypothetical protein R83H12_01049 [Fibrobacteria bacterium R8-3-H12]